MPPRKTPVVLLLTVLVILVVGSFIAIKRLSNNKIEPNVSLVNHSQEMAEDENTPVSQTAAGMYKAYSEAAVADTGYERTLVFFHAPWCPQCRAFEKNIEAGAIPAGTQILKTDYDSSTDLKKRYGVTLQTTFVQVDKRGSQLMKWVGYTSDHTLETLLSQF